MTLRAHQEWPPRQGAGLGRHQQKRESLNHQQQDVFLQHEGIHGEVCTRTVDVRRNVQAAYACERGEMAIIIK